ncbi:hypothetical protein HYZ41_02835 [archaeon]|nr:hypothetical protein [archaeon]
MKIYVAAAFSRKDDVKSIYEALKEEGHEIVADWTNHTICRPFEEKEDLTREYSIRDINGSVMCDVFIILTKDPENNISGGHKSELGGAIVSYELTKKPRIYAIEDNYNSIFYFHPAVKRMNDFKDVMEEIRK